MELEAGSAGSPRPSVGGSEGDRPSSGRQLTPMRSAIRRMTSEQSRMSDDSPDVSSPGGTRQMDKRVSFVEETLDNEPSPSSPGSRIKRRGDSVSMRKLVADLYQKILGDEQLVVFFKDKDMERIFKHQMRLMTMMFGDEEVLMHQIEGIDLRKAHMPLLVGMGLNIEHWRMFVNHFKRMLDEMPEVPLESKERACGLMDMTAHLFRPVECGELEKYGLGKDGKPSWMQDDGNGGVGI